LFISNINQIVGIDSLAGKWVNFQFNCNLEGAFEKAITAAYLSREPYAKAAITVASLWREVGREASRREI
jgi:hypothetical protein